MKIREADGDYLQLKRNSSSYSKSPQSEDASSAAASSGVSGLAATVTVPSAVKPFKISFRRIKVPFEDVRNLKPLALQFATADLEEVKMYLIDFLVFQSLIIQLLQAEIRRQHIENGSNNEC